MKDILFASDKIYSVLTIILMVFFALIAYLVRTDLKLNKMESQIKALQNENGNDAQSLNSKK
jgi:hypothetical protein